MAAFLLSVPLLLLLSPSSAVFPRGADPGGAPPPPDLILRACRATRFPSSCFSTLSESSALSSDPSAVDLVSAALSAASSAIGSPRALVDSILSSSASAPARASAARVSLEHLSLSGARLTAAAAAAGDRVADARAFASAALLYQYDCWSALKYVNSTRSVADAMAALSSLLELTSNALSMVAALQRFGPDTSIWSPPQTERDGYWGDHNIDQRGALKRSGTAALALSPDRPPNATVCKVGSCNYRTVQDAVNAAPDFGSNRFIISIKVGVYEEIVRVPFEKTNVAFVGDGMGVTVITGSRNVGHNPGVVTTYDSATVGVLGDGFAARDITFENTAGVNAHQAVAFRSDSDQSVLESVEFRAHQDTLYARSLRQLYRKCRIAGTLDFIFGNSASVFDRCTIQVVPRQEGPQKSGSSPVTAHGRTDPAQATGFVFNGCFVNGSDEFVDAYRKKPGAHRVYLGRPWKEYSRTVFINCYMGEIVRPEAQIEPPWVPISDPSLSGREGSFMVVGTQVEESSEFLVMAVAKGNSVDPLYNCYKVPGLTNPILETPHISYLEDRYLLGKELGWGQFGVIRACSDMVTGESVACKSIAKERLVTLDDICSIKLEIEVMARLSGHPNVVDLKAVYEDNDHVHIVMELCAGGELFHRLEKQGCFSEDEAAILFQHLMKVVTYCHDKGVVHRDLKPENILMATKSLSSPIKLADFGLATYIKPGQNLSGTVGSPFYIAPEVLSGGYNEAADVWSAGVILYILLSGVPPFWGKTKSRIFDSVRSAELRFPSDQWDNISDSAKELIRGMLCRNPSRRLSAKQVLEHSWFREHAQQSEVQCGKCKEVSFTHGDLGSCSFATLSVSRDVSFSSPTSVPCQTVEDQASPVFTCRSSFSSFIVDTPCSPTIGFSFHSTSESNNIGLQSPISVMPSFAFFSPDSEQVKPFSFTMDESKVNLSERELRSAKNFSSSNLATIFGRESRDSDQKILENRRGLTTNSRVIGIHSRRNHTIGLGELEQLDLAVSESVIRWASCTHLSTAPSLRSSLVC